MNEALNRFGFSEGMTQRRVPGPYVPLQDEPNDAGGIRAERNTNTVPVPQIQSMKEYILKHHKRLIFETLNRSIRTGDIDLPADADNGKVLLSSSNCTIGEMNFWRYDKYTALADVIVKPEIFTGEDIVSCPLYVELWIDMKTGMEFYAGECGFLSLLPERPYWRLDSYLIPIGYYSALIQKTPGWEYAGVFADRGVSGTQSAARDQFQKMLAECEKGNIDIILTKSLSRFARNTVDTLETVRRLKAFGVEVRFEKEGIHTLDESGELMITLFASFAQEESRSISENCKWGVRKRFRNGTIGVANKHILGYRYDNELQKYIVIPEEAEIVREMFLLFLQGNSLRTICDTLNGRGYRTVNGKLFQEATVAQLLQNEVYAGDMCRQKSYMADPIAKKKVRNKGVLPKFYYQDCHEAIIDRETWKQVQAEYDRRREKLPQIYCFTRMITCGKCGMPYTRRVQQSYGRKTARWFCRATKEKGVTCSNAIFEEDHLKRICARVLGLPEFDEAVFLNRVRHMTVVSDGSIDFDLLNGKNMHWKNRHIEDWRHPATSTDAFLGRIKCGCCGAAYHRTNYSGKLITWYCMGQRQKWAECSGRKYPDFVLRQMVSEAMGTDDFDEAVFRE